MEIIIMILCILFGISLGMVLEAILLAFFYNPKKRKDDDNDKT